MEVQYNKEKIVKTIKNYINKLDQINGKINKICLCYYLFCYLYENQDFIQDHEKFKNVVILKINELSDDVNLIKNSDKNSYTDHQLDYVNKLELTMTKLNNRLLTTY